MSNIITSLFSFAENPTGHCGDEGVRSSCEASAEQSIRLRRNEPPKTSSKKPRRLLRGGLFLWMISSFLWADDGQPKISFSEKEHHFGNVTQGVKATHLFAFKNEGTVPLKISRVQTSCGCTAAVAGKNELAPQESSDIEVTFNSAGRSGQFKKSVQVYSNDPQSPKYELMIDGTIETLFTLEPPVINLGVIKMGQPIEREVIIKTNIVGKSVRISQIDKGSQIEATLKEPVIQQNAPGRVSIKILPNVRLGPFNEKVVLKFEDPSLMALTIPVWGRVEGNIQVVPGRVNFVVRGDIHQMPPQKLQVKSQVENFEILKIESDTKIFDVQTVSIEAGKSYDVMVSLKETVQEKFFSSTIKIYTNDPTTQMIEVPVQVWMTVQKP